MSRKVGCSGPLAFVAGVESPAMSISWERPTYPDRDSGFVVFMGECRLDVDEDDWPESQPLCLHCLIEDGGEQLGVGLNLAKIHGQVDYDTEAGEWHPAQPVGEST